MVVEPEFEDSDLEIMEEKIDDSVELVIDGIEKVETYSELLDTTVLDRISELVEADVKPEVEYASLVEGSEEEANEHSAAVTVIVCWGGQASAACLRSKTNNSSLLYVSDEAADDFRIEITASRSPCE